jgi:hypothetical protein
MKFERDASTPEVIPSPRRVAGVFESVLRYDTKHIKDPEHRLKIATTMLTGTYKPKDTVYPAVARSLHEVLTRKHNDNALYISGRRTYRGIGGSNPLYKTRGLDLQQDVVGEILPRIGPLLLDDIYDSALPTEVKLSRIASVAGLVTAESQGFSDGNSRIARAIHDFIAKGPVGINNEDLYNRDRDFAPPVEIEDSIMMYQLEQQLGEQADPAFIQAARFLYGVYSAQVPLFEMKDDPEALAGERRAKRELHMNISTRLVNLFEDVESDNDRQVIATLLQSKYGSAAWAAAFEGEIPNFPLTSTSLARIEEANRQLLIGRVVALAQGVGTGGAFMIRHEGGVSRKVQWLPEASAGLPI